MDAKGVSGLDCFGSSYLLLYRSRCRIVHSKKVFKTAVHVVVFVEDSSLEVYCRPDQARIPHARYQASGERAKFVLVSLTDQTLATNKRARLPNLRLFCLCNDYWRQL